MFIKVLPSANKHNLTDEEIRHAINNIVCDKTKQKDGKNYHFAIGLLPSGKTCEMVFFVEHIDQVVVFHAMSPARKQFIKEVQRIRS